MLNSFRTFSITAFTYLREYDYKKLASSTSWKSYKRRAYFSQRELGYFILSFLNAQTHQHLMVNMRAPR